MKRLPAPAINTLPLCNSEQPEMGSRDIVRNVSQRMYGGGAVNPHNDAQYTARGWHRVLPRKGRPFRVALSAWPFRQCDLRPADCADMLKQLDEMPRMTIRRSSALIGRIRGSNRSGQIAAYFKGKFNRAVITTIFSYGDRVPGNQTFEGRNRRIAPG